MLLPAMLPKTAGLDKHLDTAMKGAFALAAVTGSFFLVRYTVRNLQSNALDNRALVEGDPAYFATLIGNHLYTEYWYRDLMYPERAELFRIFRSVPQTPGFWDKVKSAFQKRYQKTLTSELERALRPDEYTKILSIIQYGS